MFSLCYVPDYDRFYLTCLVHKTPCMQVVVESVAIYGSVSHRSMPDIKILSCHKKLEEIYVT
jgi:hypothetical protein